MGLILKQIGSFQFGAEYTSMFMMLFFHSKILNKTFTSSRTSDATGGTIIY